MINKERLIEGFKELVMIDSESGNEREIADFLKRKFADFGLEVIEDDSMEKSGHGAGNIIATLKANHETHSPVNYFTCHMDTVTPGNSIQPKIEGDYIVSDGTTILGSDDKAGIAAIFEALTILKEENIKHGEIQFLMTVGEETGLKGSKNLQQGLIRAEYGFALDSNGKVGKVIIAAPTQARIEAVVHGKSAHAGVNPEDGISAIQVASYAISKMKLGRIDSETTANIGKFYGGTATNIVTDRVNILAEARSINEEKIKKQIEHMKNVFEEAAQHFSAKVDFHHEMMYSGYHFTEEDDVVQKAIKAIRVIGRTPELMASGGGSDANIMNGYGIPTVNLGVGYQEIHTTSESMPIEELVKVTELVVELIKQNA